MNLEEIYPHIFGKRKNPARSIADIIHSNAKSIHSLLPTLNLLKNTPGDFTAERYINFIMSQIFKENIQSETVKLLDPLFNNIVGETTEHSLLKRIPIKEFLDQHKINLNYIFFNYSKIVASAYEIEIPELIRPLINTEAVKHCPIALFVPKEVLGKLKNSAQSNNSMQIPDKDDIESYALDGFFLSIIEGPDLEPKIHGRLIVPKPYLPINLNQSEFKGCLLLLVNIYMVVLNPPLDPKTAIIDDGRMFTTLDDELANVRQKFIMDNYKVTNIPNIMLVSNYIKSLSE